MNFGMMNDEAESAKIVHKAMDLGVNLFDTADVYGERGKSEQFLGKALGERRQEVIIATKFAGANVIRAVRHAGWVKALHHAGGRGEPDTARD